MGGLGELDFTVLCWYKIYFPSLAPLQARSHKSKRVKCNRWAGSLYKQIRQRQELSKNLSARLRGIFTSSASWRKNMKIFEILRPRQWCVEDLLDMKWWRVNEFIPNMSVKDKALTYWRSSKFLELAKKKYLKSLIFAQTIHSTAFCRIFLFSSFARMACQPLIILTALGKGSSAPRLQFNQLQNVWAVLYVFLCVYVCSFCLFHCSVHWCSRI